MRTFSELMLHGNAWFFIPSAIALGALHGLEPGHSKTLMAAYIVAIRGTVAQAVLLGLSATLSHTAVVWAVAMAGLYFGRDMDAGVNQAAFQLVSALIILGIAAWMAWRTWRAQEACFHGHAGHEHAEHSQTHTHAGKQLQNFARREVTSSQIALFGLTGGLIPCPAAITVLLLCLQLKQIALGATLVLSFSVGLALTLVASGVLAAWGLRHVARRWSGFEAFSAKAPYLSAGVMALVGVYVGWHGLQAL